jgi:SAM-dependent methyltransferase
MSAPPARVVHAVELLAARPGERVLEIGCGPGVAIELLCARLAAVAAGPAIVGIDRSATAITRAARRNAAAVASGLAALQETELASFAAPAGAFDAAFAINVNCFWTGPAERELAVLRRVLAPGGRLHLVFDAPPGAGGGARSHRAVEAARAALAADGWTGVAVSAGPGAVAISARRPS